MRLAIPTFGTRISPRFDCAPGLLLIEIDRGRITRRTEESLNGIPAWERIPYLAKRQVEVILAGGIRRCDYHAAQEEGLKVHAGFMGEAEEILRRYLAGTLPRFGPGFLPTGRHGRRVFHAGLKRAESGVR